MLVLIIGGAASGKSEYAEKLCVELSGEQSKLYVATMEPYGEEAKYRIERHHKLRASKGFQTLEQYRNLKEAKVNGIHTILLECMSTLLANELFTSEFTEDNNKQSEIHDAKQEQRITSEQNLTQEQGEKQEKCIESILQGIRCLQIQSEHLVLVSNKIFDDGISYNKETTEYIETLGILNCKLVEKVDVVVEVICGIPVIRKGQEKIHE